MTSSFITLKFGIQAIQAKRKDIDQVVSLIASLLKPSDELGTEGISVNTSFRSRNDWWAIRVGNTEGRILIQYGEGGLIKFDSWQVAPAAYVEDVWEALDALVVGIVQEIPAMAARMEPFLQAGRNVEYELLRAARP